LSGYSLHLIPNEGLTYDQMEVEACKLQDIASEKEAVLVFASPVPALIKITLLQECYIGGATVLLFHNDKREKKELPNGKVISVTAKDGWKLV